MSRYEGMQLRDLLRKFVLFSISADTAMATGDLDAAEQTYSELEAIAQELEQRMHVGHDHRLRLLKLEARLNEIEAKRPDHGDSRPNS